MPGNIVNRTPRLSYQAPLGFNEALNEAAYVGCSEQEQTARPQDPQDFPKLRDQIGDMLNHVMKTSAKRAFSRQP